MSARRAAKARVPVVGRTSLFGGAADAHDPEIADSIPKAVSRCRWIAVDIGAEGFGVFLVDPSMERAGLQPCFDSSHPRRSPATESISAIGGEAIVKHTRVSTVPCWWSDGAASPSERAFRDLPLVERTAELVPGLPGIAFPVFAERGACGLVVFYGSAIILAPDRLVDVHARCFWLFHAAARFGATPENEKKTSMTPREVECLKLTAEGYTSDQIAQVLGLSVHTANQYLTNCTQKLDAVNRAHAVAKAIKVGLID
jgi:DNA-binding CsgD family transcriptional regulator